VHFGVPFNFGKNISYSRGLKPCKLYDDDDDDNDNDEDKKTIVCVFQAVGQVLVKTVIL
jgi:hypothetical protein